MTDSSMIELFEKSRDSLNEGLSARRAGRERAPPLSPPPALR
jgi:hypothetical protein